MTVRRTVNDVVRTDQGVPFGGGGEYFRGLLGVSGVPNIYGGTDQCFLGLTAIAKRRRRVSRRSVPKKGGAIHCTYMRVGIIDSAPLMLQLI